MPFHVSPLQQQSSFAAFFSFPNRLTPVNFCLTPFWVRSAKAKLYHLLGCSPNVVFPPRCLLKGHLPCQALYEHNCTGLPSLPERWRDRLRYTQGPPESLGNWIRSHTWCLWLQSCGMSFFLYCLHPLFSFYSKALAILFLTPWSTDYLLWGLGSLPVRAGSGIPCSKRGVITVFWLTSPGSPLSLPSCRRPSLPLPSSPAATTTSNPKDTSVLTLRQPG